jgi:hypothetical protein
VTAAIIIAFRDRGIDPCRRQNLDCVLRWYDGLYPIHVVDDGGTGLDHFNRSRAYNRGAAVTDADVLCYIESDTLLPYEQLDLAISWAQARDGMVVAFSHQAKLGEAESDLVRHGANPDHFEPAQINETWQTTVNHGSAVVVSRASLDAVGQWDEAFEGHGHDDTAMAIAFDRCCRPMRFVPGVAVHLYHLEMDPGLSSGSHITNADMAAQDRNRHRLNQYRRAGTSEVIRALTAGLASPDWRTRAGV